MASKYLPIYLNDHLAGATLGLATARRAAGEHDGELGEFLARLSGELAVDRSALQDIMRTLGVSEDRLKVIAAWLGEKAGRLKLNGELLQPSPLSPVVELEVLALGANGKRALWRTLGALTTTEPRLDAERLTELAARAEAQIEEIEHHRAAAAARALAG